VVEPPRDHRTFVLLVLVVDVLLWSAVAAGLYLAWRLIT